jgi:hypothetical protein
LSSQAHSEGTPDDHGTTLRRATATDVPRLTELVRSAYGHYVDRIGARPRPMTDDYADVVRTHQVIVALRGGEVVGLIVLREVQLRPGTCRRAVPGPPDRRIVRAPRDDVARGGHRVPARASGSGQRLRWRPVARAGATQCAVAWRGDPAGALGRAPRGEAAAPRGAGASCIVALTRVSRVMGRRRRRSGGLPNDTEQRGPGATSEACVHIQPPMRHACARASSSEKPVQPLGRRGQAGRRVAPDRFAQ